MPILPAEPDLFPADLWRGDAAAPAPDQRWWCLHTKPRQEKQAARVLRSRCIPYYLPQVVHEGRTPKGRKTRATLPLFAGYLFLRGDDRQRMQALEGDHLANFLEVHDQEGLARDLRQIHQILASGLAVVPEPSHPVGARVRILKGPLTGLVGTVVRRGSRDHFVAVVRFLGSGARIELQDWQVERAEDEPPCGGGRDGHHPEGGAPCGSAWSRTAPSRAWSR
jgi:transcription antitermination factor NusG